MASETSSAARRPRPLSPHLQVYQPQITSVMSIMHRITGVALAVGTLLLVGWVLTVAIGDELVYARFAGFLGSWFGLLLLFAWSVALFYHLLNGIRHLFWDSGRGFELPTMQASGVAVLIGTAMLTVLVWGAASFMGLR